MRFFGSRLLSNSLRRVALWAMVPLAGVTGWPALGCLCADGTYSRNCPRLSAAASEPVLGCCCKEACCAQTADETRGCCKSAGHAPADPLQPTTPDATHCLTSSGCCHVVVQAGQLPTLVEQVPAPEVRELTCATIALVAHQACPWRSCFEASPVEDDTGQRCTDLVITLRRLII
jgi:hypothetical protein